MIATIGGDRACDGHVSVDRSRAIVLSIRLRASSDRAQLFVRSDAISPSIVGSRSYDEARSLEGCRAISVAIRLGASWISSDRNCDRPRCLEESLAILLATRLDPSRHRRRSWLRSASIPRWISGDRNCDRRRCLERSPPVVLVTSAYGSQIWLPLGTLSNNRSPLAPADSGAVKRLFTNIVRHQSAADIFRTARIASISPGRRRPHVGEVMSAERQGAEEQQDIGRASSGGSCAAHMARAALIWHFTPRSLAL